jgi:cytoskeletal protein RodZ
MEITIFIAFALCIVGAVVWFFIKNKKTSQEEVINKPSEPVSEPSAPPVDEVPKEDEKEPEKPTEEEVKPVEEENPVISEPDAPKPLVIQEEKPKYNEEYEGYLDKYSQFAKI